MQHRTTTSPRDRAGTGAGAETAPLTVATPTSTDAGATRASRRSSAAPGRAPRRRAPALRRRPGVYLGVAAAGAVLVNLVIGVDPAAQAEADVAESVSVAQALGLSAQSAPTAVEPDLQALSDLAASRGSRDAAAVEAQQVQAAADQAVLDQQRAAAEAAAAAAAAAQAEAEAAAAAAVARAEAEAAAAPPARPAGGSSSPAAPAPASGGTAVSAVARISNSAGPIASSVQAAANAVVSNVAGAGSITLGGTRPSAADPGGHPSGKALDYMVLSDQSLGNAIVQYHIAHWDELGVEYLIYRQRILQSPGGSWSTMADRGSATANHFDHVHVNYD
ncbi:hypothetical protein [Trujillonella endophytica]|uniref:ARB-07466-like C-terminal domain-containing protein n=1 Tax=Trujillonella endophytica TaxID=673521 RepID=A0A1H8Q2U8_9ACTN|nr:hypothetical protein [Trujillella endophytica]SEO48254.1 hypothetical protein SAMN05660991_00525 [Trujillella endophytica]